MVNGTKKAKSDANIGFEAKLWLAAAKLHNNVDANLKGLGYGN